MFSLSIWHILSWQLHASAGCHPPPTAAAYGDGAAWAAWAALLLASGAASGVVRVTMRGESPVLGESSNVAIRTTTIKDRQPSIASRTVAQIGTVARMGTVARIGRRMSALHGTRKPPARGVQSSHGTNNRASASSDRPAGLAAAARDQLKSVLLAQQAQMARLEAAEAEEIAEARKKQAMQMRMVLQQVKQKPEDQQDEALLGKIDEERQEAEEARAREIAKAERALGDVLEELLLTEATYLDDLRHIMEHFVTPMADILSHSVHCTIFANLSMLVELHTKLAADLAPATAMGASETTTDFRAMGDSIASAFLVLAPFFRMYAIYSANYKDVPAALSTAKQEKAVADFLRERAQRDAEEKGEGKSATLDALLFRPIQRMCVYPLLFKQATTADRKLKTLEADLKGAGQGDGVDAGAANGENKLAKVFGVIQVTLGKVNEEVRALEGHMRTMDVLVAEVRGGEALLSATRVLKFEALVDMKLNSMTLRNVCSTTISITRSEYKWYVFAYEVLVCKQAKDGLYDMKALFSLRGGEEMILEQKGEHKPEVFFTDDGGLKLKCWALGEAEKDKLLQVLEDLRAPLRGQNRRSSSVSSPGGHVYSDRL